MKPAMPKEAAVASVVTAKRTTRKPASGQPVILRATGANPSKVADNPKTKATQFGIKPATSPAADKTATKSTNVATDKAPKRRANPARPTLSETGDASARLGTRKVPRSERMAQILNVAGGIFAQRGFHSASMDDIARGAGVTKPLLYRYFGSKDALYLAAIEQVGQYLTHGVALLMTNPDPRERLEMMMLSFLTFVEKHRDGWSVLYNETLNTVGPVGERVSFFRKVFIDAVSQSIMEWLGHANTAATVQADCQAHGLVGAAEALARWWVNHPEVTLAEVQSNFSTLFEPGLQALQTAKQSEGRVKPR